MTTEKTPSTSVDSIVEHGDIQSKYMRDGTPKRCQFRGCDQIAEVRVYVKAVKDVNACEYHGNGLPVHFDLR